MNVAYFLRHTTKHLTMSIPKLRAMVYGFVSFLIILSHYELSRAYIALFKLALILVSTHPLIYFALRLSFELI